MAPDKKEHYSSIFDAASKIERKKVLDKALGDAPEKPKEAPPPLSDDEIAAKLTQYEKLHNLLADSLEEAFVKSNLSPRRLREYFNTPQNFSADQWRLVENERENVEKMIDRLLPQRAQKGPAQEVEKSQQVKPKKMQVKSRWLPMH